MLVGEHDQLDVLERVAVLGELVLQLVERAPGVRPGVDQRERVVLDQVGVDAPDRERRRDPQQVDARLGGARERRLGGELGSCSRADQRQHLLGAGLHLLLAEGLEVQAQQRLGVGGPHVEVPAAAVDRDAVEPA